MVAALKLTPPPAKKRRGKVKKTRTEKIAAFSIPGALERAAQILEGPCQGKVPRVEPRGTLVARFVLPVELCVSNADRHGKPGMHDAYKAGVFKFMRLQHPIPPPAPLPGVPLVRCIKFSSVEPDRLHNGFKVPVDCLCAAKIVRDRKTGLPRKQKYRLGIIEDDRPTKADVQQHWERAKPGEGFGMIEVYRT